MRYVFVVKGSVTSDALEALPGMSATRHPAGGTAVYGPVEEAAGLLGVLERLRDLGLSVVEIRRLPD